MPNAVGKGRGFIRLIFIPNHKKPLTVSEIADLKNIPRHIVSMRAARSKLIKKYQGQNCAVLTEEDLEPPTHRKPNGKRYIVKLTDGQVEVIMDMKGCTAEQKEVLNEIKKVIRPRPNAVGIWNDMVRKKKNG